jgi:ABC-type phosphate transport system substrate-binding protein
MHFFLVIASLSTLLAAATSTPSGSGKQPAYRVVVHPSNPSAALDRRFLEDAFLKKVKIWPTGDAIRPVDLEPNSETRRRFTEEVLRRPLSAVRAYWQQRIFSGRDVPPPEMDTDEDIVRYVRKHAGAVGYVSGKAPLDGVKALPVQ